MSNALYTLAGTLTLSRMTPVIEILFAGYTLTAAKSSKTTDGGVVFIGCPLGGSGSSWNNIRKDLVNLGIDRGVLDFTAVNATLRQTIAALAFSAGADVAPAMASRLERVLSVAEASPEKRPDLASLFVLAQTLDDGHGLKNITVVHNNTGAAMIDMPELSHWETTFCGHEINLFAHAGVCPELALAMDSALSRDEIGHAAVLLFSVCEATLSGINSPQKCASVREELHRLLASSAARGAA